MAELKKVKNKTSILFPKNALTSVSSGIAAMFLKDAIGKGYGMEIPSLGIKIEGKKVINKTKE